MSEARVTADDLTNKADWRDSAPRYCIACGEHHAPARNLMTHDGFYLGEYYTTVQCPNIERAS